MICVRRKRLQRRTKNKTAKQSQKGEEARFASLADLAAKSEAEAEGGNADEILMGELTAKMRIHPLSSHSPQLQSLSELQLTPMGTPGHSPQPSLAMAMPAMSMGHSAQQSIQIQQQIALSFVPQSPSQSQPQPQCVTPREIHLTPQGMGPSEVIPALPVEATAEAQT